MVFNLLSVNILFGIPCQENEASTRTFGSLQVWADYLASRLLGGRPFLPSFRNLLEISGKKCGNLEELVSVGRAKSLGVDLPHERVEWLRI